MLYCTKISAVLFLQNYCVLLQGVYNIIVDNTGAAAPGWRNTDMTKQEMLQLKMTATRVRMGIIEATHGGKSGHPGGSLSAADAVVLGHFLCDGVCHNDGNGIICGCDIHKPDQ